MIRSFQKGFAVFLICLLSSSALAQAAPPKAKTPQGVTAPVKATIHDTAVPDLLRETQVSIGEKGYAGLVWWVPFEFWLQSAEARGVSREKTAENLKALKDYTVVGMFLASVTDFGAFHYVTPLELRQKVTLRDSAGNEYKPIDNPAEDAKTLAAVMKPALTNAMGPAGENFEMMFFPARAKNGEPIADATAKGMFAVVLRDPPDLPEIVYQWRLPLTSVSPPKYCPVGKERVQANWDYCPWHGVSLNPAKKNP
ncbi:MAG TPA: hypothetical protein VLV49_06755 [Terriglobales bacterium]|nr:hypothetical protein [Terriglobales bacterium]